MQSPKKMAVVVALYLAGLRGYHGTLLFNFTWLHKSLFPCVGTALRGYAGTVLSLQKSLVPCPVRCYDGTFFIHQLFFSFFFFFRLWRLNYFKATSKASSRMSCESCKLIHLKEKKMFWEWCVIVFFISLLIINESSWLRLLSCYILPGWLTWVILFF